MQIKETDVAKAVIAWLKDSKWEVYQEVESDPGYPCPRADIVARMDPVLWVIEVKNSFSLKVLEQAVKWGRYANCISVAVPKKKGQWRSYTAGRRDFESSLCTLLGVGLIEINVRKGFEVKEIIPPKLRRKVAYKQLRSLLKEEQKTWAEAGNADNNYYTPFKATVRDVVGYVSKNRGCTMREVLENVHHHYRSDSTARACLSKFILGGIIGEIEMVRGDKEKRMYLKGDAPNLKQQSVLF